MSTRTTCLKDEGENVGTFMTVRKCLLGIQGKVCQDGHDKKQQKKKKERIIWRSVMIQ